MDCIQVRDYVEKSGLKLSHVARVVGVSPNTLRMKLNGETEFKLSEAQRLAELLRLTAEQREAFFFGGTA